MDAENPTQALKGEIIAVLSREGVSAASREGVADVIMRGLVAHGFTKKSENRISHERLYIKDAEISGFDWFYVACACGLVSLWGGHPGSESKCPNE